ncbi:50S ribosomal protein L13 [Persicimonas caeni]|uniref:Large ribosomal subunit protein uL13 n=1 Tax=Persicimonas caeni TaxID=2292766 RepID=A0A4Y6PYK0_PERCE|nr:50S ribosomal protein L13 [Persicimonas caeni]QDG53402.1 50S ribosomal protein L13 [Persicimonas caeni]QED34623.1 50S ribosomal protein L13 [Persicimonas caeni]
MKTFSVKEQDVERAWHLVDLEGKTVGRAASEIAKLLRGKHKPIYTPHVDCGDFVVCINADKVEFSGNKLTDKMYRRHSLYPGGLKEIGAGELMEKAPEKVIEFAVQGMLPKNTLGRKIIKKLKVYSGADHPHSAQQPQTFEID